MKYFLLLVLLLGGAAMTQAQPGSTGPALGALIDVPLDGGASLLLAGGVAYGLRRQAACQR